MTRVWPRRRAARPRDNRSANRFRGINMMRLIAAFPLLLAFSPSKFHCRDDRSKEGTDSGTIAVSKPGGWVMNADGETLSCPPRAAPS